MKRILILYTSVGLGHKIIAENIGWHLSKAGYEVRLADILEVQSGTLVNFGTWLHQLINTKLPFIWRWLYMSTIVTKLIIKFRTPLAAKNSAQTEQLIKDFNPDLVISTQITASAVMGYLIQAGLYKGKFAIAFSDYHLHPSWVHSVADLYFVNIEEQKREMVQLGVPESKIAVLGMTLQPNAPINSEKIKEKLGIRLHVPVLLLSSGSLGTGLTVEWIVNRVNKIKIALPDAEVLIVTGKNAALKEELDQVLSASAHIYGFYTPMAELYSIADLFVTKPGGLSVAESLSWKLPLLITHWLPGQEELNYIYLRKNKLIMPIDTNVKPVDFISAIIEELKFHTFKNSLALNEVRKEIIQENNLGNGLIKAINTLFHSV